MPTELVKQHNKPRDMLAESCGVPWLSVNVQRVQMVTGKLLGQLKECIQLYDEKNGNDYAVVFGKGKKDVVEYCQITFNCYNFWHLLGCKLINGDHVGVYNKCKDGGDVSEALSLVHSYSEAYVKCGVFRKVFDFASNAKYIKIGYVADCPEGFYLTMALGNEMGIIGYDYVKGGKKFLVPKSVQDRKISSVSNGLNKILFILSKKQNQKAYVNIEYEIKKGVAKGYFPEISKEIAISDICNM